MDDGKSYDSVKSSGIEQSRSPIMQGERPLPVPPGLVERFIALTGTYGLLNRLDPAGRALVLVSIMSGEIPIDMDSRELVAIA